MKDLTSLLTLVSSCETTIIAILGGFISSRLINIIDERKRIEDRIKLIDDDLFLKNEKINEYEKQVVDSYAHEFLLNHIDDLIDNKKLDDIFNIKDITIDDMYEHWEKSKKILQLINTYILQHASYTKQDICSHLEKNNYNKYDLEIASSIIEWIQYKQRKIDSAYSVIVMPPIKPINLGRVKDIENKENFIEEKKLEVSWLDIEKRNLINKKNILKNPIKFIDLIKLFTVPLFSILTSMIMLIHPYTDSYKVYLLCCIINIFLFCLGVIIIIKYLYDRLYGNNS